ncbi:MAG: SipW-dependent-type signal peptide-containing protein [Marmoricola sp.]
MSAGKPTGLGRGVIALTVAAAVLLIGGHGSLAFWTDSSKVTGTTITTGSIDLKLGGADNTTFSALSISAMVPGETTAGVLVVRNAGRSPLKYTVDASATNTDGKNLASVLVVKVTTAAAVTGTGHARTCGGTAISGSGTSFTVGLIPTARTLAPGAQETICVQATLPIAAPVSTTTAYQSATTTATLAFKALQVTS